MPLHGRNAVRTKLKVLLFAQTLPTSIAFSLFFFSVVCVSSLRNAHLNCQKAVCVWKDSIGVNVTLEPLEIEIHCY